MKKQDVAIIKTFVERNVNLSQGAKVELGLIDVKEKKRLTRTLKPFMHKSMKAVFD